MTVWMKAHPVLSGMIGGVAGVGVSLLVWHLYIDHRNLHEVITFLNQAVANQAKAPTTGK